MYPSCTFGGSCADPARPTLPILIASAALALNLLLLALRIGLAPAHAKHHGRPGGGRGFADRARRYVQRVGGPVILAFKTAQLATLAALLGLVLLTAIREEWRVFDVILAEVLAFAVLLALTNVFVSARTALTLSPHLTVLSFIVFAVYAYRDIWPLMTYTLRPEDESEGNVMWIKVILALWAGVLGPILVPYAYIPLHHEFSESRRNAEQTASIFSRMFFTFLDPVIWRASRATSLSHEDLPPLSDYDQAEYLAEQSFPHLDPLCKEKKTSLLWAMLIVMRRPIFYQIICILCMAMVRLASPIGVNHLLRFLEKDGQDAGVRPWVWILWIGLGPVADTVLKQQNTFLATRALARMEATLTALVFEHALRLRARNGADGGGESEHGSAKAATSGGSLVGRIMNLATSDLDSITSARDWLILCVGVPAELGFALWFLHDILGWSALVGFAVMAVLFTAFKDVAQLMTRAQREKMRATDARVQLETETLGVVRTIKLLGWSPRVQERLEARREQELKWIWRRLVLGFVNFNANQLIPVLCMVASYSTYTMVMHRNLTASVVFSSITVFNNIRMLMDRTSSILGPVTAAYTSIGRLQDFLYNSELLSTYTDPPSNSPLPVHPDVVGVAHSAFTFTWSTAPPSGSQHTFALRVPGQIRFQRGSLNIITGPTGAGKTSLLLALLGEIRGAPAGADAPAWVGLPRGGGVAYAAQEAWVLSDTVKENILFGAPYDEDRYDRVIRQCALMKDLERLGAGDMTQVGEKGITLSGGQKARITLARAVYSSAEILLLDDVLAALDAHTSRWIVDECFKGDLMAGRTVILVTHNLALVAPLASLIVPVSSTGEVRCRDRAGIDETTSTQRADDRSSRRSSTLDFRVSDGAGDKPMPRPREDSKLVVPEEKSLGRINRKAYKMYLRAMGSILHWFGYLTAETLAQVGTVLQVWWLGWWAKQYGTHAHVDAPYYLAMYAGIVAATITFFLTQSLTDSLGRIRASRTIHRQLVSAVMGTTFRWLDKTPTSRVVTRFTQDMQAVDGAVPQAINILTNTFIAMAIKFVAVFVYAPILLVPSVIVVGLGACIGNVYIKAQLAVKREMSTRRAPVLAVLSSAVHGLISIRAYSAQDQFRAQLLQRVNNYTRVSRTFWCLNQWIAVRLDSLSALFAAGVAWYLVYASSISASGVGFVLAMAVSFTDLVLGLVNWFNQLEVNANSLERLDEYTQIEQEPKGGEAPPAHWPTSGDLQVKCLSASYVADGPKVLQNITFSMKSGERIGIVGRTGAGKSTLTLALLRCIHTEGDITFDGIPANALALDSLRSNITIIPQVPELLSGSLRYNLDPFYQQDEAALYDALYSAGMFSLQQSAGSTRITLDTEITGSGGNLSVGQRQIIALARAIVRQSKLLILDEATSAIDHHTDAVIQESLREENKRGASVITVAHRLQTVMDYDKIMVLDAGRLVEFDTPRALLEREDGLFHALVESSQNKEALYAAAYGH